MSDQGSYFEQEKLIALDKEEQSRWENETVIASRSKIEDKGKDEPAEPDSQESWQKLAGRTIVAGKFREINFLPVLSRRCDFVGECFRKIWAWFMHVEKTSKIFNCPTVHSQIPTQR